MATIYQRVQLADEVELEAGEVLTVEGFPGDTLVTAALTSLAAATAVEPSWRVRLTKQIPVAAGLGGGSSDAATALRLANETLTESLAAPDLERLAASVGADVPFFLRTGPQLGTGDGTTLEPLELPQDCAVLLLLPHGTSKASTAAVYDEFDRRDGANGWNDRRSALLEQLSTLRTSRDLADLPGNDLAVSPLASRLRELGAFRADVSGAGPAVYGLFNDEPEAVAAAVAVEPHGRVWITALAW